MASRPGPDVGRSRPVLAGPAVAIGIGIMLALVAVAALLMGRDLIAWLFGGSGLLVLLVGAWSAVTGNERPPDEGVL